MMPPAGRGIAPILTGGFRGDPPPGQDVICQKIVQGIRQEASGFPAAHPAATRIVPPFSPADSVTKECLVNDTSQPSSSTEPILSRIIRPADVAGLNHEEKEDLAGELRERIIRTVAANGGHLAPSLGVVELTIALLSVFNPEEDKVIWDVGHQSYAWKLLTGRADMFHTLRRLDGISGFPKREESRYDHFGVGHSSTSVSAALGMALARDLAGLKHHVLAVIGDGSLTAGLAFEGLNQAGDMGRRLIVVLNDNEMSISPNVGALSLFLSRNMERGWARRMRREVKELLKSIPGIGEEIAAYAQRTHRSLKTVFTPGMLFEAFRFNYIGPVNGHDLEALERHLHMAASIDDQPVLLHVLTRKGKGYAPAETRPTTFHGIGRFDATTGEVFARPADAPPTYTEVFGNTLCSLAERDKRIVAITAAMSSGTGTGPFRARFPDRFVDVGICEQHAVTFAAGLAAQGYRPFVALYSTFAQRAYDQIVHDVCLQNLPVTLCLDRAGLVGEDGPTHHGAFDLSFLRHIPNLSMAAPRDEAQLQAALLAAPDFGAPLAIRYPRGAASGRPLPETPRPLRPGEGEWLREGQDAVLLTIGSMTGPALAAAERLARESGRQAAVFDACWLKPLPEAQLLDLAQRFRTILIAEENALAGGFSSAVLELLADRDMLAGLRIRRIGLPDAFVEHGAQAALRARIGLDEEGVLAALRELLSSGIC